MDIGLIIFDCDGVLVDSEPLAMRVLLETIAAEGLDIDPDTGFRQFLGRSLAAVIANLNAEHGLHLNDAALERMRGNLYALFRRELRPMAGLIDALAEIHLPVCVASSSQMERIRLSLTLTGLIDRFDPAIYSAAMVPHGKPAPDLFLHAAAAMWTAPADCIVIEDSPAGIVAAQRAGMRVFAFLGGSHIAASGLRAEIEALNPTLVFDDMHQLPDLIQQERRRGRGAEVRKLLVAVDVGTGSARAGVLSASGELRGRAEAPILMRRTSALEAEHDSTQIWQAVAAAVRAAMRAADAQPADIAAIGFDATCSLVIRDQDGAPLPVAPGADSHWDTIVWLDHRALAEAAECTATHHSVLGSLGGVMSPEMQIPKLMWLKRHLPDTWSAMGQAFDLVDFLTYSASGSFARSQSTLTCKWTFQPQQTPGWQSDFLATVGLSDLVARAALPAQANPAGTDLGPLTAKAAGELGLTTACRVAAGLIDAHAGALGVLGAGLTRPATIDQHLCLIAGTSNSVLALAPDPRPVAGLWGPYLGAMLPDLWLTEAGQSATGALLDHLIRWHRAGGEPDSTRHQAIADRIAELRAVEGVGFAERLHVLPDFHGNRSPLAEPGALGVISGLGLDSDFDSLCRLYWRSAVALALGMRQNLEALASAGYGVGTLLLGGGHARNPLLVELYADATGATVIEPNAPDAVLLGTAMLAATAAGLAPNLAAAAAAMDQGGIARRPDPAAKPRYDRDYAILLAMQRQRRELDAMGASRRA